MISRIIEFSIRNRFLVLLLTFALIAASIWGTLHLSLDAIPDLSDVQVIIVTNDEGQNPEVIDKQVTYPLASAMLSVPRATAVRGYSMFGLSFVYVLFEDGTDIYWARSRVLEYLNFARDRLPAGVDPKLGPDATGVGWVYQYVLYPGFYSPDHPKGLWHDETTNTWYASPEQAPASQRDRLAKVRAWEAPGADPLTHTPLVSANQDLSQLRSLQDWYLRYPLTSVEGVSEVAPIGGFVKQYQVILDPDKLKAFKLPLKDIMMAIQRSNNDVGGATVELSENEYMVRSRGYLQGVPDLEKVPVGMAGGEGPGAGTPILLSDVAKVQVGGEMRRGIGEYNGEGELAGGIIVARFHENAYRVIQNVKAKLAALEDGLPPGVIIKTTYDRSALIERSIHTLRHTLIEEITVVGLVCILFLLHARSELVAVFVVPASVLVALFLMQILGINANIMSLGGIAIAIGVVVDSAIVMVENAHKHLDREEERVHRLEMENRKSKIENPITTRPRGQIILEAAQEVGPSLFFSLLIITVSFLPVFVLGGESGRLFKPLAMTKTFAMGAASILSITIIPVLMYYFITSRVLPKRWGWIANSLITLATMFIPATVLWLVADMFEPLKPWQWWMAGGWAVLAGMLLIPQKIIHEKHSPISVVLQWLYDPFFWLAMKLRWVMPVLALLALASTWYPISHFGREFMPRLDEGDLLYMPTTFSSISVTKAKELLQQSDKLIKSFPEVLSVHGKIGRADTATDPAPMSMIETVVQLQPDTSKWRHRQVRYFFSDWPNWLKAPLAHCWPEDRPVATEELRSGWDDPDGTHHAGLDEVVQFPSVQNEWPYPIENRITMLSTGMKSKIGIKILGPDLPTLDDLADKVTAAVMTIPGANAFPERTMGGLYLDIDVNAEEAARYGLTKGDVQDVITAAIGGMNITTTVEGPARYPLNVRYPSELRDDIPALQHLLVSTPRNSQIPLGQLASFKITPGPSMIRSENATLAAWIYVDVDLSKRDLGGYVAEAKRVVANSVQLPAGYQMLWSGQFEYWEKTLPRLIGAICVTVVLIIFLLYVGTKSWFRVAVVLLALPFSLIGACWFTYLLGYNLSLAVYIGMIALAGLDAETGLVMLLYLDNSFERFTKMGRMRSPKDLYDAIHDGAVKRIRPKAMTVAAAFIGLVPLLWAHGSGADVMRRLAAPLIGGLLVSFIMELLLYPVIFYIAKRITLRRTWQTPARPEIAAPEPVAVH
ncbi:MAG TPA: efflux RND transporter permease subunit [Phycisphaerae bacterium]|nr:efflux RND transporter permease subunit [Phycisphaerae bacterium]